MNASSPSSESRSDGPGIPRWIPALAALSALASTGIYLHRAGNYFFGDDFELLADAYRGVTLFEPVSAHLRPLVRLWFELLALWPTATFVHLASLGIHAGGSLIVAWFVRSVGQSPRVAATAGLLFYGSFLANEAVYWISAVGVIVCVGFSVLALIADLKGRTWVALGMLVLASLVLERIEDARREGDLSR